MPVAEARVRTNGFQWPLNPFQLISWVVVSLDVLLFSIIGIPLIESDALKVIISLVFGGSVGILVCGCVSATSCDPADPHIRQQDHGVKVKEEDDTSLPYCPQCDSPVLARSKHCRACNKCVREFDHHCMWMNNCIGASNYKAFAVCIGSVAVMTANILGINVYLLIEFLVSGEAFEVRWHDHFLFQDVDKEIALIPCLFLTIVNLPFFVLDMQLVLLHIFLTRQNVTTYEYIMKIKHSPPEPEKVEGQEAEPRKGRSFRSLPRCMDWIIIDRSKLKKRKETKVPEKRAAASSATSSDSDAPVVIEASADGAPGTMPAPPTPPMTAPPVAPHAASPVSAGMADGGWRPAGPSDTSKAEVIDDRRE